MITYREALNVITSVAKTKGTENVVLENTVGRILSRDVLSPEMLPPFANSAMDGFAFRHSDIKSFDSNPRLKVQGTIAAGDNINQDLKTESLQAWEIMTGAPIPHDCDTVIRVEDTKKHDEDILFLNHCRKNQNLRFSGEDFKTGDRVAIKGTRIYPEHIMAFAALGINSLPVYEGPSVSILSTGKELDIDCNNSVGKIRNSTAPYLKAELSSLHIDNSFLGTIKDEPQQFIDVIKSQIERETDVIISTGAVSMGKYDFVASALRDLGADILFHKVAIRPGKPLLFATLGKTVFFGVPGNPVSSVVGLRFFIEPYLRMLQGLPPERGLKVRLENEVKKPDGLRCFFKANTDFASEAKTTVILNGQESFKTASLLNANSWAVLPEEGKTLMQEAEIDVFPLHSWSQKEILL